MAGGLDKKSARQQSLEQIPREKLKEVLAKLKRGETVNEIENAIRILKMTDEEVVSTSTYNAIARYL